MKVDDSKLLSNRGLPEEHMQYVIVNDFLVIVLMNDLGEVGFLYF